MKYEEAENILSPNLHLVGTNGNKKFPYFIERLLILPIERNPETEQYIIRLVVRENVSIKKAIEVCELTNETFDVYLFTNSKMVIPILLSEYNS